MIQSSVGTATPGATPPSPIATISRCKTLPSHCAWWSPPHNEVVAIMAPPAMVAKLEAVFNHWKKRFLKHGITLEGLKYDFG